MSNINKLYTEYDIQALVDNELDWEEEKRVREFISNNHQALKRYTEYKNQKKLLENWHQTRLQEDHKT